MRYTFTTVLILLFSYSIHAQGFIKNYLNSILKDTVSEEKAKLSIYPTVAFSPETSFELGFSTIYVYKAKQRKENRLSEINSFTFYTLRNQYGLFLNHALYTDHNDWFFLGELKFKSFPLKYFGIGPDSPNKSLATINGNDLFLKERVLKKITKSYYTGLEIGFQSLTNISIEDNNIETFESTDNIVGIDGSTNLSLGWGFIHDDIHNILNAREGFYSEWAFLHSNKAWGSDYSFTNFFIDNRLFKPINERNVLAMQLFSKIGIGDVPFNQLALIGGEFLMRGYYLGRFRDKALLASQIEYRMLPFSFSKRWGGTVFLSTGGVGPTIGDLSLSNFKLAGGAGLRFLLYPKKDVYTRLDVAFTEQGAGVYVLIGEAF